ncbi:TM2 domain-containing protein [Brachybacterium sacelli]|uniref:TM2 domain-containing protein n=1 Tax=Brachybacterium sacelli TaxID=173364 RepID=A0ABS4X2Q8_9MICO|nr:TM2 domain-containing protein [Brachybacterium sacelli]MBP2382739.1 hypothetical protein [Brachybacterium sacelli]
MSTSNGNASWDPQEGQQDGQQNPYGQASSGEQQYGQQNPYGAPPQGEQVPVSQDPFAQASSGEQQYGQQNPYGAPPQGDQVPVSQDPYAQSAASDPSGQATPGWSPAGGSAPSAGDPYGQGAGGGYGPGGPPQGPGGQGPGGQVPAGAPQGGPGGQGQSRLLVGLMGIFFGGFGVHRFLMGYTTIGLVQVLVSVLSCFTLYPFIQIWGLVEGIMVLAKSPNFERDAHGRPLTD